MKLTNKLKEINELKANFETLSEKLKISKASYHDDPKMCEIMDFVYSMMESCHRRIDYISEDIYSFIDKHSEGHIPPIVGAERMNKALKVLGLDDDYEAYPKYISANTKNGLTIELNYSKNK